ncbi:MAG: flagellar motor protein MotB [Lachnospiraceae bacterium]|jgi:chemotaxis protein MotB|nr:flagellar motor protein MotB [Lachnospiraceae bacterium]
MAKRKEDTPPPGAPAWMATFSDLMNLLLCFFVMLFAMSTLEESKLQEMVAAMNNSISIFEKGATAIGEGILISNGVSQLNELDQFINSTGKTADSKTDGDNMEEYDQSSEAMEQYLQEEKLKENEELAERIEEALNENNIGDEVELSFTSQFVQLTMNGALLFDSGRAELKEKAEQMLDKIGVILERYGTGIIEIEGHTDNVPMSSSRYASNEELSSARALSVFYYLRDTTFLDPVNLKHSGMGERAPIADNTTEEGRSRNRRVEIRIFNPSQGQ